MLIIPIFPKDEPESIQYTVFLNGSPVKLYDARVSAMPYNTVWPGQQRPLSQTELAPFFSFEANEPVTVCITAGHDFNEVTVRPISKRIKAFTEGRNIEFVLRNTGQYTVELDGFHCALHIFSNPIADFGVSPGDEDVIYFGPGIHRMRLFEIKSHQTVYIDAGAVVYGSILAMNSTDVKIVGYGILDDSYEQRYDDTYLLPDDFDSEINTDDEIRTVLARKKVLNGCIRFYRCQNSLIKGIICRDSSTFTVIPANCDNIVIDNLKAIGMWRYNSDGIDLFNSANCVIQNCFLRNFDDCMVIKGICGWDHRNNENIIVRSCVIWCDWGRALEIGAETCAPEYRNIIFEDCDIIHGSSVNLDIQHHNRADIHLIVFQNIRIEYTKYQLSDVYQHDMNAPYNPPEPVRYPLIMATPVLNSALFMKKIEHGRTHDIIFRDIYVIKDDDVPMPPSSFTGFSPVNNVYNIMIDGLYVNGMRLTDREEANLFLNEFADNIILK
jgi:hypothetical protein